MSNGKSCLPEVAQIELDQLSQIEKTNAECAELLGAAQQRCRLELDGLPEIIQNDRKSAISKAKEKAEAAAAEVLEKEEDRGRRLSSILDRSVDDIVDELCRMVLPQVSPSDDPGVGQ